MQDKHTCTRGEYQAMQRYSRGVVDIAYRVAAIGSQGCWGCLHGNSALLCMCMCARHACAMILPGALVFSTRHNGSFSFVTSSTTSQANALQQSSWWLLSSKSQTYNAVPGLGFFFYNVVTSSVIVTKITRICGVD
jgi:hypothetical protein